MMGIGHWVRQVSKVTQIKEKEKHDSKKDHPRTSDYFGIDFGT